MLLLVQVYKMVMSIGWNPFYNNTEKTAEPWILHDFDQVGQQHQAAGRAAEKLSHLAVTAKCH
jgi:FAD synthase